MSVSVVACRVLEDSVSVGVAEFKIRGVSFCIGCASQITVDCGYQLSFEWFRFDSDIHHAPASFHDLIVASRFLFDSLSVVSFHFISVLLCNPALLLRLLLCMIIWILRELLHLSLLLLCKPGLLRN